MTPTLPSELDPGPGPAPPTDIEVIQASLGSPERFGEIFDRHAPAIHRYLSRRVGSSVADDLAAETFLVAFRQRGRYDTGRGEVLPWLFGIATNLLRRHRRREVAQYRAFARTGTDPVADHAETVAARIAAPDQVRAVVGALARLPAKHRDVILLIVWGGLGYDDTARALDLPAGTVRSRLHRARQVLRDAVEGL